MEKKRTFRGGIHPLRKINEGKDITSQIAIEEMEPPAVVYIPMSQHAGAPAQPAVEPGDHVKMGQLVGEAQGFFSVPVHSSVSGKVLEIARIPNINGKPVEAVVIENDYQDEQQFLPGVDFEQMTAEEILERIQQAGSVGMGGAAFPAHVKLQPPEDKPIQALLINGAECEPFLTADDRLMIEQPEKVIYGIKILMKVLGLERAVVGIEDNKPTAIIKMREAVDIPGIAIEVVKTKYPQGSEKQLITALANCEVPSGGLPMDVGVIVQNVTSAAAIAEAFLFGEPVIRRVVTVSGAVSEPKNLVVRIGTMVEDVIKAVNGYTAKPLKLLSGGPMMGEAVPSVKCVITKGFSGLLVLDEQYTGLDKETNCIRCGKCVSVCPVHLIPSELSEAAAGEDFERAERGQAMDCINCGSCSYVCPAKKPISQNIKFAKEMITIERMKKREPMEVKGEN